MRTSSSTGRSRCDGYRASHTPRNEAGMMEGHSLRPCGYHAFLRGRDYSSEYSSLDVQRRHGPQSPKHDALHVNPRIAWLSGILAAAPVSPSSRGSLVFSSSPLRGRRLSGASRSTCRSALAVAIFHLFYSCSSHRLSCPGTRPRCPAPEQRQR